ncbi:unnamed protein product, partial [Protopolystoma xenopodis]
MLSAKSFSLVYVVLKNTHSIQINEGRERLDALGREIGVQRVEKARLLSQQQHDRDTFVMEKHLITLEQEAKRTEIRENQ